MLILIKKRGKYDLPILIKIIKGLNVFVIKTILILDTNTTIEKTAIPVEWK
jgi:hypothetical protein